MDQHLADRLAKVKIHMNLPGNRENDYMQFLSWMQILEILNMARATFSGLNTEYEQMFNQVLEAEEHLRNLYNKGR